MAIASTVTAYEKRSEQLLLPPCIRLGPGLAAMIRRRAHVNDRTIQLELLWLIRVGLKYCTCSNLGSKPGPCRSPFGPYEKKLAMLDMPRMLRVSSDLAKTIRERAYANSRTIQLEIVHLVKVGIKADPIQLDEKS